jgi:hypothetical protein
LSKPKLIRSCRAEEEEEEEDGGRTLEGHLLPLPHLKIRLQDFE